MTSTTKRDNKLQFDNFVVFFNFLEALQQHCKPELSRLRTATDLKSLATHPEIVQYESVLVDGNFVLRWYKLYADCVTNQKFQSKSLAEEANMIINALSNRCDLLIKFNDFPAPPSKNLVDMKRYDAELSALIVRHKNVYNGIQKWFIDQCIMMARANIKMLDWQSHLKDVCYRLKWRSLASTLKCSNSPNFKTKLADVSDYMMLASPGHCKCESQASNHGKSRKPKSSAEDRPTAADSSVSRTAEVQQHPNALPTVPTVDKSINSARLNLASEPVSNTEIQPIEKAQSPVVPSPTALKRAVHFTTSPAVSGAAEAQHDSTVFPRAPTVNITFNVAGNMAPEPVLYEKTQPTDKRQASVLPPTLAIKRTANFLISPASEPSPKRPCQTPAPEINEPTKLGKYAIFKQFLEDLLKEFSSELSAFKTPSEMKDFLANQPAMKSFQEIFMNKNFVTQWKELHGKCDPIPTAPNTMATAAREIAIGLAKKGSLIKHFADFPAKPQNNKVEDLERCIGKIKIMLKKQPEYDFSQMKYLTNLQLTLQRKLTRLHNLLDVIQPRSGKSGHAAPSAEAAVISQGSCATTAAVHKSLDSKSAKMRAVEYFIKENPDLPEADVYREFSYLEPEKRNRYVEMAEAASGNVC